jgi:hypothetical protein
MIIENLKFGLIAKVNSGCSIHKAEVTSANPQAEITLANFTPLSHFML